MKLIHWTIAWWYPSVRNANLIADWWSLQVQLWYSTRGFLYTISHIKNIRLHITRYICGHPLMEVQGNYRLRKDGLVRGMNPLNDLLDTNEGISFVLTLLNISRCLPGLKDPDLSTITEPWKGYINYQLREFIPEFGKLYNLEDYSTSFTLSDLANSSKSGPIGVTTPTSVLQAHKVVKLEKELVALTGGYPKGFEVNGRFFQPLPNIMKPIAKWAPVVEKWFNNLVPIFHSRSPQLVDNLRKLSIVNDPEGKARIICIFDYWSQTALKEVHNWAFSQLMRIPQDRTFDQNPFAIDPHDGPFYSIDLTAATDRFPIELQKLFLESLSNAEIASAWSSLLTDHDVYVPWKKSTVKYAAGQPMGAYSSWAVFALTHHLVVQYSAKASGKTLPFTKYMLLGDDIVIADKTVADKYIETMQELDVGISLHKTHVSETTYEFAKRWIHKGVEVSAIPLKGLSSSWKKYHLLVPFIYHILEHRVTVKPTTMLQLVYDLYVRMGFNSRHAKSICNRVAEFTAVWKYMKDDNTTPILELIKNRDSQWHPFPNTEKDIKEYLDWLLERTVTREIIQITEDLDGFLIGMHKRWNKLFVEDLTSQQEFKDDVYPCLSYHPQWQSLQAESGRIDEKTREIIKDKRWRDFLKIVSIPDPTKILEDRHNIKLAQCTAKFAKNVFKTAEMQRKKDIWFLAQFD